MKFQNLQKLFVVVIGLFFFTACGGRTEPAPAPVDEVDVQATVDAAIQATATAEAQLQEVVDTAVSAAVDDAVADALEATAEAMSTPIPPEEIATMSEEELAALIEQIVADAAVATESYADATTQATADNTVTTAEVQTIEIYVYGAEEAIALAEEMLYLYNDLYADLTYAAINDMDALIAELDELNQNLTEIVIVLDEINTTLASGLALAEETIAQLETAAANAMTQAVAAQTQAQAWQQLVQAEIANRTVSLDSIQPQMVAATRQEAINQTVSYLTTVQNAFSDEALSLAELNAIAQMSADTVASLQSQGGPQLQTLAAGIDAATMQMAAGNLNGALVSLNDVNNLVATLPDLANVPSLPAEGFSLPTLPGGRRP